MWRWLGELHRRLARGGLSLEHWATAEALEIRGFSLADAAAFYSQVFARRFRQHPDEGYADLEDIMQGKDPSFGYSVLAHILAETRHKLVITTNFDNLVGEALSIFTGTAPLVCGHESLANFVHVEPRRPVVVKIHRDLLMAPMNQAAEIAALQTAWVEPLTRVFRAYTPIVIGYGGNDGSLMGFLNGLPEDAIPGGLFWCYYGPAGPPGPEIRRLVARHRGVLVPIEGFDELMLRLSARLRIPLLDQVIESKARARVDNYRRRVEELQARLFPPAIAAAEEEEAMPAELDRAEQPREPVSSARPSTSSPLAPSESTSLAPAPLPGPAAEPPPPPRRGLESARLSPVLSARPPSPRPSERSSPATQPVLSGSPPGSPPAGRPAPSTRDVDLALPASSEPEAEHVPSDTSPPDASVGANRREPTPRLGRLAGSPLADEFAKVAADETSKLRLATGESAAPRSWTTGPLQRLPAKASELQRALQQVAGETAAADPWTISLQARAEPYDDRALALLRAGLEQFPGDRTLSLDLVERLTEAPTKASVQAALSALTALLAAQPDDKLALAHTVLLLAWLNQFPGADEALLRLRHVVGRDPSAMEVAGLAFLAGLLLRLQGLDDGRALAPFQVHAHGISPIIGLPFGLIVDLVRRLDPDSRQFYLHLAQRLAGSLTADELIRREPRLAELPPFDPATFDGV
ncbi:hypothetical protein [Nannocystis pusilla]|uniref:hypothetical protein n=1 Tax=Nannocystis pusilla TaxID=889268 RepID=UPI003DA2D5F2